VDFQLNDEQRAIRGLAREFATQEVAPVAAELDREGRFPYEIVAKLGELGFMGMPFPQEYGGGGTDYISYALVIEELARADSSVAITVAAHTSLGSFPIHAFGSERQRRNGFPSSARGNGSPPSGSPSPKRVRTRPRCTPPRAATARNG